MGGQETGLSMSDLQAFERERQQQRERNRDTLQYRMRVLREAVSVIRSIEDESVFESYEPTRMTLLRLIVKQREKLITLTKEPD